jgi:hypothetical protein
MTGSMDIEYLLTATRSARKSLDLDRDAYLLPGRATVLSLTP